MKKQIVEASLKAFGFEVEKIVAAAQQPEARARHLRAGQRDSRPPRRIRTPRRRSARCNEKIAALQRRHREAHRRPRARSPTPADEPQGPGAEGARVLPTPGRRRAAEAVIRFSFAHPSKQERPHETDSVRKAVPRAGGRSASSASWSIKRYGDELQELGRRQGDGRARPEHAVTKDDFKRQLNGQLQDAPRDGKVAVNADAAARRSGSGKLNRPLKVGINTWAGHAPGIVANGGMTPGARRVALQEEVRPRRGVRAHRGPDRQAERLHQGRHRHHVGHRRLVRPRGQRAGGAGHPGASPSSRRTGAAAATASSRSRPSSRSRT